MDAQQRTFVSPSGEEYVWDKPTPPTQADIDAIIAYDASLSKKAKVQAPMPQAKPSAIASNLPFGIGIAEQLFPGSVAQMGIGAAKSLASHVVNLANWLGGTEAVKSTPLGSLYYAKQVLDAAAKAKDPAVKDAASALEPYLKLSNTPQKIGAFMESIAEIAAPGAAVSRTANVARGVAETTLANAPRLLRRVGGVGAQAAVEGAVGGAQNVSQGGDFTTGALLGAGVSGILHGIKAPMAGTKNVAPETKEALDYMQQIGANVPVGVATNIAPLKYMQQTLENVSVASALSAAAKKRKTSQAITEKAKQFVEEAGAGVSSEATKYSAGSNIEKTLNQNVAGLKAHSSSLYKEIENAVKSGKTSSVDLASTRPALQQLVDDTQYEVEQILASSPNAMPSDVNKVLFLSKKLLELPDRADISQVDNVLKNLKRVQASESIAPNTKRLLGIVIDPIEQSLQNAVEQSGLKKTFDMARGTWSRAKEIEEYADVLTKGNEQEKARIADALVVNYDKSLDRLKQLKEYAPSSIPELAQSWLNDKITAATAPETGIINRAKELQSAWKNLGVESKKILFGPAVANDPQYIKNLTDLVNGAFLLTRELNPSGSGFVAGNLASGGLMLSNPLLGLKAEFGSFVLTKMLRSPKIVKLLAEGARLDTSVKGTQARLIIRQQIMDEINAIKKDQQ